jgi:L-alanine-DL-glutamate epimerase-like enolase superfamily enzyme
MTAHVAETTVDVVVAEISDVESRGRGEGVPLRRYGETIDSVIAEIESMKGAVLSGLNRDTLQHALPPGAARNALDCAFWDIDAKRAYCSVAELAGLGAVPPLMTAFTVAFDTPDKMAEQAAANRTQPLLKLELGATAMSNGCGRCGKRRRRRASSSMPTRAGMRPSLANTCRCSSI